MSVMISSVLKNECMLIWTCFCDFIVDLLKVKKKKKMKFKSRIHRALSIFGSLGFCSMQFENHWHKGLLLDGKQSAGTQDRKAESVALLTWTTEQRNDLSCYLVNSPKDTMWQVALHPVGVLGLSSPFSEKGWGIEEWGRLKTKPKPPPPPVKCLYSRRNTVFKTVCSVVLAIFMPLLESVLSDVFVLWKAFNLIHEKGQNNVSEGSLSSLVVFLTEGFSLSALQHNYCKQNPLTHEVEKPPSFVVVYFEVHRLYILSFDFRNNREGSSPLQVLTEHVTLFLLIQNIFSDLWIWGPCV